MDNRLHPHRRTPEVDKEKLLQHLEEENETIFQKGRDAIQEGAVLTAICFQRQHELLEKLIQEIKGGAYDV